MKLETIILRHLIQDETFMRKTIPHLKHKYFEGPHAHVFKGIVDFVNKYSEVPESTALSIEMQQHANLPGQDTAETFDIISELGDKVKDVNDDWLLQQTEKWCQDRSIFLAIMESINIIDGKHKDLTKNALPELLQDALAVNFDTNVGHDYINDSDERYEFYHKKEEHLELDLKMMNTITKGGFVNKSLNIAMAGTGVGKSLFMCHCAASSLSSGKNVLYISMEMSEERVAERIDANLMNVQIDQLGNLSKDMFDKKVHHIANKGVGKLIIKEYPTGAAHVGHFRALLTELKMKRNFIPDLICIDYINICASSRMKDMSHTYTYVKAIAEELRGMAVEQNVPILSATQTTRGGFDNSDVGLTDTSESFGLPATADLMFALITTEELDNLNQIMIKQLKNRYNDPTGKTRRFVLGIDRSKMRLYDVEDSAQSIIDTDQVKKPVDDYEGFQL